MEDVRVAELSDIAELLGMVEMATAEVAELKGGARYLERESRPAPTEASLRLALEGDDEYVVVGTIDDVIIAFAAARTETLRTGDKIGELTEIWVMPEARGVGVGEVMLDDIMDWARSHGCVSLEGSVHPGNRHAKNFFERAAMVTRLLRVSTSLER